MGSVFFHTTMRWPKIGPNLLFCTLGARKEGRTNTVGKGAKIKKIRPVIALTVGVPPFQVSTRTGEVGSL